MAFLDSASGRPVSAAVADAVKIAVTQGFVDPSALHADGRRARALIDAARQSLAADLGAPHDALTIDADLETAIRRTLSGLVDGLDDDVRVIASAVERSAVLDAAEVIVGSERIDLIPVNHVGRVDVDALDAALAACDGRAVVAIQAANQEVGTRQPLEAIRAVCTHYAAPLLVDASTTAPWEPIPAADAVVAEFSAWGGPAGAVSIVTTRHRFRPSAVLVAGASRTDIGALVGAATALRACRDDDAAAARVSGLADLIRLQVAELISDAEVLGDAVDRVPHLVTFSALYVPGEAAVTAFDRLGIAVGSGSACISGTREPSHVLRAMGALTHGNIRIGLHPAVTPADVTAFLDAAPGVIDDVRRMTDAGAGA